MAWSMWAQARALKGVRGRSGRSGSRQIAHASQQQLAVDAVVAVDAADGLALVVDVDAAAPARGWAARASATRAAAALATAAWAAAL